MQNVLSDYDAKQARAYANEECVTLPLLFCCSVVVHIIFFPSYLCWLAPRLVDAFLIFICCCVYIQWFVVTVLLGTIIDAKHITFSSVNICLITQIPNVDNKVSGRCF